MSSPLDMTLDALGAGVRAGTESFRTARQSGAEGFASAEPTLDESLFCGHCGERLPRFGGRLGYCAPCAQSFRRVVNQQRPPRVVPPPPPTVHRKDPLLASVLSGFLPGGGQVYNGHFIKAGLVFVTAPLVLPWIIGVADAFFSARKINEQAGTS